MMLGDRAPEPVGDTVKRARSNLAALLALTALLLSGALPAFPHDHLTPSAPARSISDETRCPCPDDHLDRQGNGASDLCPICFFNRLAAHGPVAAEEVRATAPAESALPSTSEPLPERFLASWTEARGPPIT